MENWADWISSSAAVLTLIAVIGALWRLSRWQGSVDTEIKWIKKLLDEVRNFIFTGTVQGSSPLQLTNKGKKVAKSIRASEWSNSLSKTLRSEIKEKSHYEIQELALEYVQSDRLNPDEEQFRLIRSTAYDNGITEYEVRRVLGIVLRDKLLETDPS